MIFPVDLARLVGLFYYRMIEYGIYRPVRKLEPAGAVDRPIGLTIYTLFTGSYRFTLLPSHIRMANLIILTFTRPIIKVFLPNCPKKGFLHTS